VVTQRNRLLYLLKQEDRWISAKYAAEILEINHNSCRGALSRLKKEGEVLHKDRLWAIKSIHGDKFDQEFRVQNLHGITENVGCSIEDRVIIEYPLDSSNKPFFRLIVNFSKNGNANFSVKSPRGLDVIHLCLLEKMLENLLWRYNLRKQEWKITSLELFNELMGYNMSDVKSLTLSDLINGVFEKFYNKSYGVRREVRINKKMRFESINVLMREGMPNFQFVHRMSHVETKMEAVLEAQKRTNRAMQEIVKNHNMLLDGQFNMTDRMDDLMIDLFALYTRWTRNNI
jgi:hypothetical protein